jgi:hypothetical protein
MTLLIGIGLLLAWWFLVCLAKELCTEVKQRRGDRIMAAWEHQEEARQHAQNLVNIERVRWAATEEMVRVAAEAKGDIIESTAIDVRAS